MAYGALKRPANGIHRVGDGDTISSIAALYGFTDWEAKVWNAPENAKLKTQRSNPNTLVPGDEVFIPELEKKQESRPTDAWHDFHVVRNKRFLRLKLQDENGDPIKNQKYELKTGPTFRGTFRQQRETTDDQGQIEEEIPHTLIDAELVLPEVHLRVKLKIGSLRPMPTSAPVKSPALGDLAGAVSGAVSGQASGLLGAAQGALGGLASAATGAASGSLSGGAGLSGGGGGLSGGLGGIGSAAGGLASAVQGTAGAFAKTALSSASAFAGPIAGAVAGVLGDGAFGKETDPNIYSAAQRLDSMGFNAGEPKNDRRTAQFSAAVMAFQTWCKERGAMPAGAGGMLGDLTAPSGALSGGGPLGDIGTALAGPLLSAVGLTGQLDQPTVDALKKIHGC